MLVLIALLNCRITTRLLSTNLSIRRWSQFVDGLQPRCWLRCQNPRLHPQVRVLRLHLLSQVMLLKMHLLQTMIPWLLWPRHPQVVVTDTGVDIITVLIEGEDIITIVVKDHLPLEEVEVVTQAVDLSYLRLPHPMTSRRSSSFIMQMRSWMSLQLNWIPLMEEKILFDALTLSINWGEIIAIIFECTSLWM